MEGHRRHPDDSVPHWYGGPAYERAPDEQPAGGDTGAGWLRGPGDTGTGRLRSAEDTGPGGDADAGPGGYGTGPVVPAPLVAPPPPGVLPTEPPTMQALRGARPWGGGPPPDAGATFGSVAGAGGGPAFGSMAGAGGGVSFGSAAGAGGGATFGPASGPGAERPGLLPPAAADLGAPPRPADEAVYATRRPALGLLFVVLVVLLAVPAIRLFVAAAFAGVPAAREIVPASLLLLGLPLTGVGLWGLANGGRVGDRGAWLRPPVGYLAIGVTLLVAAGVAAG